MFFDRPQISEGSVIINATVPSGPTFPSDPSPAEIYYLTATVAGVGDPGLYYYAGAWTRIAAFGELNAHMGDDSRHLTAAQNTLLDGTTVTFADLNSIPTLKDRIDQHQVDISNHVNNQNIHVTAAQKTLLNGLNPSLTATELNYVVGVTSSIQSQLDALVTKNNQQDTAISTGTSDLGSANQATQTDLDTHKADNTRHLTTAQNTLLDGITIQFADVNKLSGIETFLGGSSLATYLAAQNTAKLSINGTNSMTANLSVGGFRVTNVADPVALTDAATKQYVDNFAQGIHWAQSARVATTGNVSLTGLQTIDDVTLVAGNRVLVKDQTNAVQNGVWLAATGAWSRAQDYNSTSEVSSSAVFVLAGTLNQRSTWVQTTIDPVIDTDQIIFTAFSGPTITTAGAGIALTGVANIVADIYTGGGLLLTVDGSTSAPTNADAKLALSNVGTAGTYRSVTTDAKGRVTAGTNPTTLAGYGITDAATSASLGNYVAKAGDFMSGPLVMGANSLAAGMPSTSSIGFNAPTATAVGSLVGYRQNALRWRIDMPSASAQGDFAVHRFNDSGTYVNTPLSIDRAAGTVTMPEGLNTTVVNASTSLYAPYVGVWSGTGGRVTLQAGGAANTGYIEFVRPTTLIRQGYIGFSSSTSATGDGGQINYVANGGHIFSGAITSNGDITAFSDARLKTDVETIKDALDKVEALRGVSFTKDGKQNIGVIAQEVQEVVPEVVHQQEEYLSVAYGNLVGLLIEAVKELSERVKELENPSKGEPWPFPRAAP